MRRESPLEPGRRLGPYTVVELLGQGGMAQVYLATHEDGQSHALKVIRADDAVQTRRFLREFESLRLLRVPGVVRVYQAGHSGDRVWFSMDRVFGKPFHDAVLEERYPPDRVERTVALATRLMGTLSALHASGFSHRDLKPSNVLVDAGGTPHVLDFGVSRWFADEGSSTDIVLGTVPYMAPEQFASLPVGPPADVFAAGLMLHEAVAGLPDRPRNPLGWVARTCMERREPLAVRYREVPLSLSRLVERMLEANPEDRPTAKEAVRELEAIRAGKRGSEWPTPAFVDPGEWWQPVEGILQKDPRVCILSGSRGSGRSRLAEQVQRIALLEGTWTFRLSCAIDRVGGPWLDLLTQLTDLLREDTLAEIAGEDFDVLATIWPHLPLPRSAEVSGARARSMPVAIAQMIRRLADKRDIALLVDHLEDADVLTARTLAELTRDGPPMLLLLEHRWSTTTTRSLVRQLKRHGAQLVPVQRHRNSAEIAASLCPADPPEVPRSASPTAAVEAGWAALAAWRGERFEPLADALIPFGVHPRAIPIPVARRIAGRTAESMPWVEASGDGIQLSGSSARLMAEARLGDRLRTARKVADRWEKALDHRADPRDLARLRLLAGDPAAAWRHAVRAGLAEDRLGRYGEARSWLLVSESLTPQSEVDPELAFELAWTKAHVALRTDPLIARRRLLAAAEGLATTEIQQMRARVLECGYALREGEPRRALATALHVGNQGAVDPGTAARGLLVAVQVRMGLGDTLAARRELDRASDLADRSDDPLLDLEVSGWEAALFWEARELHHAEALCRANLARAAALDSTVARAGALARLAAVLRLRGDRSKAEGAARRARDAFRASGDVFLDAEARLALATLEAERGELVDSRARLDKALRHIRGLHLDHLVPAAMRLALRVAAVRGDIHDGNLALRELEAQSTADDEAPAALVRWWRARGELERALGVERPRNPGFGRGLWHMERARVRLAQARNEDAREEAVVALVIAAVGGFADLLLYARLVVDGLDPTTDPDRVTHLLDRASASPWVDLALAALDVQARRDADRNRSRRTWRTLAARARELGYHADAEEAEAWQGAPG